MADERVTETPGFFQSNPNFLTGAAGLLGMLGAGTAGDQNSWQYQLGSLVASQADAQIAAKRNEAQINAILGKHMQQQPGQQQTQQTGVQSPQAGMQQSVPGPTQAQTDALSFAAQNPTVPITSGLGGGLGGLGTIQPGYSPIFMR